MNQEEIIEKLSELEKKIYGLTLKCDTLQKQLDAAIEENLEQKELIKKQKEQISHFQNQENFNKIVSAIVAESSNPAGLRKKLNEFIADLDQCIQFLDQY